MLNRMANYLPGLKPLKSNWTFMVVGDKAASMALTGSQASKESESNGNGSMMPRSKAEQTAPNSS